jgi:hypothetical protein
MWSHGLPTPWNIISSTSPKSFLRRTEGTLWVVRAIRLLKKSLKQLHQSRFFGSHHLSYFVQVGLSDAEDAENKFVWPFDTLKHRFIFKKFVFYDVQKAYYEFLGPFAYLKHKRIHQNRFFRCLEFRKWVRMAYRRHHISHHRLHQSRFLRRPEGRLLVLITTQILKTSLKRPCTSRFFRCPWFKKWERKGFRYLETSLHWLRRSRSLDVQKADNDFSGPYFKYHLNDFIQVTYFDNHDVEYFAWPSDNLKVRFTDYTGHFLWRPEVTFWVLKAIQLLRKTLKGIHQSRFFGRSGCRKLFRWAFWHLQASLHRLY